MNKLFDKWRFLPNSVKSAIVFTIATFITKGISFLVTPIFTRLMDISDYGIIVTYTSWMSIIDVFAVISLTSAGVFNVGLNDNKDRRDQYISTCIILCNITTLISFGIIFFIKYFFIKDLILDFQLLLIMFIHFLFNPAQIFWLTRQKYEYKYKLASLITILSIILSQGLSILALLIFKDNPIFFKTLGNEIGLLIIALPIYIILLIKGKKYFDLKEWIKILKLAIPLIPHYLAQHIMTSSDRIMISNYVNKAGAAIYGVVSYISLIASIIWNSINASLVPYTFEKLNDKKYNEINKTCMKLLIGCTLVCLLIILFAPEILGILAPKNYSSGIYIVPPLVYTVYLSALYNLFANIEFYYKKTSEIAMATCIASVINVILNILLIPRFGVVAAAYTTLISSIVNVLMHYINYTKCQEKRIYNIKYILILSILLLIVSLLSNLLYLNIIIRYVLLLLLMFICILKRNWFVNLFKIKTRGIFNNKQ